jgi:hypothetical protein
MERRLTDTILTVQGDTPVRAGEAVHRRTKLGRRLQRIRARIVASGEPLLGWEDIAREVAERRGEKG